MEKLLIAAWMAATEHRDDLSEYARLEYSSTDAPWVKTSLRRKFETPPAPDRPIQFQGLAGTPEVEA